MLMTWAQRPMLSRAIKEAPTAQPPNRSEPITTVGSQAGVRVQEAINSTLIRDIIYKTGYQISAS